VTSGLESTRSAASAGKPSRHLADMQA